MRERGRETERKRDREGVRERERDRKTERQRGREGVRERGRERVISVEKLLLHKSIV